MGRPRKRQRVDNQPCADDVPAVSQPSDARSRPFPSTAADFALNPEISERDRERTNFENICNAAISQSVKRSAHDARISAGRSGSSNRIGSQNSSNTSPYDAPRTPTEGTDVSIAVASDPSQWPDFSEMTMPLLVQDRNEREKPFHAGNMGTDSNSDHLNVPGNAPYSNYLSGTDNNLSAIGQFPTVPACPCLPNLYLTLSTLSSLSAFPVSSEMIDTLLNAHRTCRSVIYCPVCPRKMQSGSQNVFLSTMLVTVLADHWHRVKKASAKELRTGFGNLDLQLTSPDQPMGLREDLEWRTFGYHLVRAFGFGDQPIPDPPGSTPSASTRKPEVIPTHISSEDRDSSTIYTLNSLVYALERRQKQWHDIEPYQNLNEFPPRLEHDHLHAEAHTRVHGLPVSYAPGMTLEDLKKCEDEVRAKAVADDPFLCLKIVKHSRMMMQSLEGDVPRI